MNRVIAPAKLTRSLSVTGVRPDGYHELRAEMVALDLADELTFTEGASGLRITAQPGTRAESLEGVEGNLITRALAAVGRAAAVEVVKRIPVGGGLGGGSSDAAAVLRWAGCTDPDVAIGLGSDVPFSLTGGRALVEGIGETVTPLPFEAQDFVLLIPPFGVDTGRVYAAWDERRLSGKPSGGTNELTEAALSVEPALARWRDLFGELTGADPVLAGSGSTWFVEGRSSAGSIEDPGWLVSGADRARLLRVRTVPAGWHGS